MTDREKLIEILSVPIYPHELADPTEVVADYLIANGVTVQKRGEWINERELVGGFSSVWGADCSECGWIEKDRKPNYCPNCGAYMRGKEE